MFVFMIIVGVKNKSKEPLNKSSMTSQRTKREDVIFSFLTKSITYSD